VMQSVEVESAEFWTSVAAELLFPSNNFFSDNIDQIRFAGQASLRRSIRDPLLRLIATQHIAAAVCRPIEGTRDIWPHVG
jgi:hypothetical protein